MKSTLTILMMAAFVLFMASCNKDSFSEKDAIEAQKELLKLKYQHEIDLETLKQKGATALQELYNKAALEQLRLNDSLIAARAKDAKRQDYSVTVLDVLDNTPLMDADVTVSSEGKIFTAKTNAQGVATFTALYLFPTSTFLVSKEGYAAAQILQQYITSGPVKLWNSSNLSNEIYGILYIDTDLTTAAPETVRADVLVTASTMIQGSNQSSYKAYFPTYTKADGTYSVKVPASPNPYTIDLEQIQADQKLVINGTEHDNNAAFPQSLPRVATIKTFFNANIFLINVPQVNMSYYFKVTPDKNGKTLFIPGNEYYYNNNAFVNVIGNKYQLSHLNIDYLGATSTDYYTYSPNSLIDITMVDVAGNLIENAPKLMAKTNASGKILYYYSPEGGYGYVHLKRDKNGVLASGARGLFLKANPYDGATFILNFSQLNYTNTYVAPFEFMLGGRGDRRVINYYYGQGSSRETQVY